MKIVFLTFLEQKKTGSSLFANGEFFCEDLFHVFGIDKHEGMSGLTCPFLEVCVRTCRNRFLDANRFYDPV